MARKRSLAPSTRYLYERALARLDQALDGRPLDDTALADYLSSLFRDGKSQGTVKQVVHAVRFRARLAGEIDPVGPDCAWVLAENRYENLPPSAAAQIVGSLRYRAKLLGDSFPDGPDDEVFNEIKRHVRRLQRLKHNRGPMPQGRRFMGELYRRDLDFPSTLRKGPRFRTCRACGRSDVRLSGIFWCFACALAIKEARARVRGKIGLLTSIFGGDNRYGDLEWKSLKATIRGIRTPP